MNILCHTSGAEVDVEDREKGDEWWTLKHGIAPPDFKEYKVEDGMYPLTSTNTKLRTVCTK